MVGPVFVVEAVLVEAFVAVDEVYVSLVGVAFAAEADEVFVVVVVSVDAVY